MTSVQREGRVADVRIDSVFDDSRLADLRTVGVIDDRERKRDSSDFFEVPEFGAQARLFPALSVNFGISTVLLRKLSFRR